MLILVNSVLKCPTSGAQCVCVCVYGMLCTSGKVVLIILVSVEDTVTSEKRLLYNVYCPCIIIIINIIIISSYFSVFTGFSRYFSS